jgi:hypothetical protein
LTLLRDEGIYAQRLKNSLLFNYGEQKPIILPKLVGKKRVSERKTISKYEPAEYGNFKKRMQKH